MSSFSLFILIVAIIALLFIAINLVLAPHNPYGEKNSPFECGFHSFLQSRSPFYVSFFIYGFVFLILDLEVLLLFPFAVSEYVNDVYGLIVTLIFISIISIGFVFELARGALEISSRQNSKTNTSQSISIISYLGKVNSKGLVNNSHIKEQKRFSSGVAKVSFGGKAPFNSKGSLLFGSSL